MIVNWPQDLINDIARRRCVLFLGAGISCQARNAQGLSPKGWADFLVSANRDLIQNRTLKTQIKALVDDKDFLTACQVIKDRAGDPQFHDFVRAEYLAPRFEAAAIHDSIINLDSRIVATPNFDKIFENRINYLQQSSVAVKNYYDNDVAEYIRGMGRVVIKVHGTIDTPNTMIFTRTEYARARHLHRSFYSIFEALAITHTFLFLGCGLNDPDIRLLLEDYAFKHNFGRPHYFVLPRGQIHNVITPAVEKSLNIKCLTYDPRNNFQLLKDAIDELKVEVEVKRQDLQQTSDW